MGAFRTALEALSPTFYFRLDETSGTTVTDSSGNGFNGTYSGSVTLNQTSIVPIAEGTSILTSNASEGGVTLNSSSSLDPSTNEWCLVGWISFTGTNSAFVIRLIDSSNRGPQFIVNPSGLSAGSLRCRNQNITSETVDSASGGYNDGNPHLIVGQRRLDGSQWKQEIYVDGSLENSKDLSSAIQLSILTQQRVLFYGGGTSGFTLDGYSDEYAYFASTALTPTQISDLYDTVSTVDAALSLGSKAKFLESTIKAFSHNLSLNLNSFGKTDELNNPGKAVDLVLNSKSKSDQDLIYTGEGSISLDLIGQENEDVQVNFNSSLDLNTIVDEQELLNLDIDVLLSLMVKPLVKESAERFIPGSLILSIISPETNSVLRETFDSLNLSIINSDNKETFIAKFTSLLLSIISRENEEGPVDFFKDLELSNRISQNILTQTQYYPLAPLNSFISEKGQLSVSYDTELKLSSISSINESILIDFFTSILLSTTSSQNEESQVNFESSLLLDTTTSLVQVGSLPFFGELSLSNIAKWDNDTLKTIGVDLKNKDRVVLVDRVNREVLVFKDEIGRIVIAIKEPNGRLVLINQ